MTILFYSVGMVIAFVLLLLQGVIVGFQGLKGTGNPYFSSRILQLAFSALALSGAWAVGFTLYVMYITATGGSFDN